MRVFQKIHKYEPYIPDFERRYDIEGLSFKEHLNLLIKDRFYGLHLLKPILDQDDESFYTIWNYDSLQKKWAAENGIPNASRKEILWAQIEHFKPDVLYSASPTFFSKEDYTNVDPKILKVCWAASPVMRDDLLSNYAIRLTNLPSFLEDESSKLIRTELFEPAFDPVMDDINEERDLDLFFYGQYIGSYFKTRNELIDKLVELKIKSGLNIKLCLQIKKETVPIVNIPLVRRYLKKTYPNKNVFEQSSSPVYGLELYKTIARSKVIFNCAVDFSGNYKVNMRNYETLGLGALMISDVGIYPKGFEAGKHFDTYKSFDEFEKKLFYYLENEDKRQQVANAGHEFVKNTYSKEHQWSEFQRIVSK